MICKACGVGIEVEDEYIPGIRGAEMALYQPVRGGIAEFRNRRWQKTLTCGNAGCGKTFEYRSDDLLLYHD